MIFFHLGLIKQLSYKKYSIHKHLTNHDPTIPEWQVVHRH